MKLVAVTRNSAKGKSPSLFLDDDGSYYIQGYLVGAECAERANVPAGEMLVKVDESLLKEISKNFL